VVITDLVRPQSPGIPAPDRRRQGRIVHSLEAFNATEQFVPRNPRTLIDASSFGNNQRLQHPGVRADQQPLTDTGEGVEPIILTLLPEGMNQLLEETLKRAENDADPDNHDLAEWARSQLPLNEPTSQP
jgi:hypothetical protein